MKPYQDHCPVKDQGKAEPKPKRPTSHTYRTSRFQVSVPRSFFVNTRDEERRATGKRSVPSLRTIIAICLGFVKGVRR